MIPLSALTAAASHLDHPEGVAYATDGFAYATGEAGQVYRIDLTTGTVEVVGNSGGFGLGIAADADNNLYVCDMGIKAVVRLNQDRRSEIYSRGAADEPLNVPNFPVFDSSGNLYVSNSGDWGARNGHIQRIGPDREAIVWSRAAAGFTNGLTLSPDNRFLYVVESNPPLISRVAIKADGTAGVYGVVVELPGCVPDGIAFDTTGALYIACYAPDRIYRLTSDGSLDILFDDWARITLNSPTNLAFAGRALDQLLIASLGGRNIMCWHAEIAGAPLHYPRLDQ